MARPHLFPRVCNTRCARGPAQRDHTSHVGACQAPCGCGGAMHADQCGAGCVLRVIVQRVDAARLAGPRAPCTGSFSAHLRRRDTPLTLSCGSSARSVTKQQVSAMRSKCWYLLYPAANAGSAELHDGQLFVHLSAGARQNEPPLAPGVFHAPTRLAWTQAPPPRRALAVTV